MKISIGCNLQSGPWGGGNQFAQSLVQYLINYGVEVRFDLADPRIDLILLFEPRLNLRISAYSDFDIFRYLQSVNGKAIIVHRVNECDERKQTNTVNRILRRANLCADSTIFVSEWLKNLHIDQGMQARNPIVIRNGADPTVFNSSGYERWHSNRPLKLVTHHWGANWLKGFDIYERVDKMISSPINGRPLEFTYVGNLPKGFRFENSYYQPPLSGSKLAQALRRNHVYLTASQNEPGSNHQNEGACCGLPLLYRNSGSLPEYCDGFGVMFNADNIEEKLGEMMDTYPHWADKMQDYPHRSARTNEKYLQHFQMLLNRRDEILKKRDRRRLLRWLLKIRPIDLVRLRRMRP